MSAIVKSLTSLVSSIAETLGAALQSVYVVFQYLLHATLSTIQAVTAVLRGALSGLVQIFEVKRALTASTGNIVVIGVILVAFVVYTAYQQQRRPSAGVAPTMRKKTD